MLVVSQALSDQCLRTFALVYLSRIMLLLVLLRRGRKSSGTPRDRLSVTVPVSRFISERLARQDDVLLAPCQDHDARGGVQMMIEIDFMVTA